MSLRLHPIDLDYRATHRTKRGEPRMSDIETGTDILEQLKVLSDPFHTEIDIEKVGNRVVGKVKLS